MKYSIAPSLPANSFAELAALGAALKDQVKELQVDLVDGQFVSAISWPFNEPEPVDALSRLTLLRQDFALEMDCMVVTPERYLDVFVGLGIGRVVIHMGSTDAYQDIYRHAQRNNYQVGLALMNNRPLAELDEHMEQINFVQLMGITAIGQQGQPFDEGTLDRAAELRANYPNLEIAVDGSVNKDTILRLKAAGVNRFLPGSAIAKARDPLAAYQELKALIDN